MFPCAITLNRTHLLILWYDEKQTPFPQRAAVVHWENGVWASWKEWPSLPFEFDPWDTSTGFTATVVQNKNQSLTIFVFTILERMQDDSLTSLLVVAYYDMPAMNLGKWTVGKELIISTSTTAKQHDIISI